MIATGVFPKGFQIVPGGRAIGWLEHDVNHWIIQRKSKDDLDLCIRQNPRSTRQPRGSAPYAASTPTNGDIHG